MLSNLGHHAARLKHITSMRGDDAAPLLYGFPSTMIVRSETGTLKQKERSRSKPAPHRGPLVRMPIAVIGG
jgi:hypothetical protein